MKAAAIILIVLCLAAVGVVGWMYMTTNLEVVSVGCVAVDAVDQQETFDRLKQEALLETLAGTVFQSPKEATAENSLFYTYTFRISNHTFLKAEVIEISITSMSGDYLQIGEDGFRDLPAGKSGEMTTTILSAKGGHQVREARVTWYFWGIPFSAKVTCK